MPEENVIVGVQLDFSAGNAEQTAAKVKALADSMAEEHATAQSKGGGGGADLSARLKDVQKQVTQAFKAAGDFASTPEAKALQSEIRQYLNSLAKAAQQGVADAMSDVSRTSGAQRVRGGAIREGGREREQERDPNLYRRNAQGRPTYRGRFVTEEEYGRMQRAPGGYGPPGGGRPPAPPTVAEPPEEPRKLTATERRRLAEAGRLGIPGAEQLGGAELISQTRRYQELERGNPRRGIPGVNPQGMSPEQVDAKLEELQVAAAEAAVALREVTVATKEQEAAAKAARGGAVADARGAPQQGFMRELLQASTLGIGGYRRFGHLQEGQLAGGALQALPTGLITGGAFTAFYALQQGVSQAVRNAVQLDRQLADVKDTVDSMGQGGQFDKMRDGILGISDATGVAATDVAGLAQIFLGLTQNVDKATVATKAVAQFIEVTGESAAQAGPEIATIMQNLGISAQQAGNAAITAGRAAGRTPQEISQGVAGIAPVANLLGINANQAYGLVAGAARGSAMSGTEIGSGLDRILEGFQQNIAALHGEGIQFQQPQNVRQDLVDLIKQFGGLPQASQVGVANALGGPRNIQVLSALTKNPQTLGLLQGNYTDNNALQQRAAAVNQTAGQSLKELGASFTTLASQLLNSGLGTALSDLAKTASLATHLFGDLLSLMTRLNSDLGGVPGKLVELGAGLALLARLMRALPGIGGAVGGVLSRATGKDPAVQANTVAIDDNTVWTERLSVAVEENTLAQGGKGLPGGLPGRVAGEAEKVVGAGAAAEAAAVPEEALALGAPELIPLVAAAVAAFGTAAILKAVSGPTPQQKIQVELNALPAGGGVPGGAPAVRLIPGTNRQEPSTIPSLTPGVIDAQTGQIVPQTPPGVIPQQSGPVQLTPEQQKAGWTLDPKTGAITAPTPRNARYVYDPKAFGGSGSYVPQGGTYAPLSAYQRQQGYAIGPQGPESPVEATLRAGATIPAEGAYLRAQAQLAQRAQARRAAQAVTATGAEPGAPNLQAIVGPRASFQTVGDVTTAFQAGLINYNTALKDAADAVKNASGGPIGQFQAAVEAWNLKIQTTVQRIGQVATFGPTVGGLGPAGVLQGTLTAQRGQSLGNEAGAQMAATIAQQISTANDQLVQNLGRTGGFAGAAPGTVPGGALAQIESGRGTVLSARDAAEQNARLVAAGGTAQFRAGAQPLTPQQIQAESAQLTSVQQAATAQQVAAAQAHQASAVKMAQDQLAGDQQVLASLKAEQAAQPNVNLGPQITAAATKVYQDEVSQQQANLANIQALSTYTQSLDFQNPIKQAQDQIGAANASAASLGTTVAQLQSVPFDTLSDPQKQVLQQWAAGQQAMFQGIASNTQAQIAYLQSGSQANALRQAQQAIGSLAGQAVQQFGSQGAAQAQAAGGNPAAQQLVTQQNQANFQAFQAQQANVQGFWQAYASQAQAIGNSVAAAGYNVQAGQAAVALFRQKFPADANLGNSQFAQLVSQLNQAQGAYFQAQVQQIQTVAATQAAHFSAAGNSLQAAAAAQNSAIAQLNRFKQLFPSQANLGNQEYATLLGQVYQAQGAYFQAQLQQIQSVAQVQQAQIGLTGNTPAVAANALQAARAALAAFKAKFPTQANSGNAEFNQLTAAVYAAQGNLLDQTISFNETQISELVATNKISIGQAITKLRALQAQAAAAGNQADVLKIQADIQQYINQGNENAAFNLPTNLNLPTLYEVRRTEGTPKGGNYYGNTGPVNVNINISNQVDVQPAVNALIRSIGGPPTSGLNLP